ncbi:MAG: archaeosortase/exosortase family protein [Planctomycetota bacterium]|nr:archaeosortase/exosortase family protein [Planctomycetota bacterium]
MIVVTVGAQMTFDRLIRAVDEWAGRRGRSDVFAQVGAGGYHPRNIQWAEFLSPGELLAKIEAADAVVAHAGMGSILMALEMGKPILVMPRHGKLMETRNDHQVATADRFLSQGRVSVAQDEQELMSRLDGLDRLKAAPRISSRASDQLTDTLREFAASQDITCDGRELALRTISRVRRRHATVSPGSSIQTDVADELRGSATAANGRNRWSMWHAVASIVLVALAVLVTSDSWSDIIRLAQKDEESSHIMVVPLILAWLFWVRRERLELCRPRGTWVGPLIALAGWFLYSFGDEKLVQLFWHGGAIMLAAGCLLTIVGKDALLRFVPVFAALAFLAPVPGRFRQYVAMPLGSVTAQITQEILTVFGVAVERSGNLLSINSVDVTIAEACNGLRMVVGLALVSFTFAFVSQMKLSTRFIIVAASPLLAIACNFIRLIPTLWLYGHVSKPYADAFHDISGWFMLPLALLILVGIVNLFRWAMMPIVTVEGAYRLRGAS